MGKRHIETLWQSYREKVVPPDASEVQVRETRLAFFAGAGSLLHFLSGTLDDTGDPNDVTPGDMSVMEDIGAEIDEFVAAAHNEASGARN